MHLHIRIPVGARFAKQLSFDGWCSDARGNQSDKQAPTCEYHFSFFLLATRAELPRYGLVFNHRRFKC